MGTKKTLGGVLAVGAAAATFGLAGVGTAQATPGGCTTGWASDGVARGSCSSGTGQFRIGIPCKSVATLGYGFTQYSPWVNRTQVAQVSCGFGAWLWTDIPGGPQIILEKRN